MQRSMAEFMALKKRAGLSMSQLSTLMRLYHNGDCVVSDIADELGVSNAAASQMVERLVSLGYLGRAEDPNDRRQKVITLSATGRAMIEEGIEARWRWMESLTEALTADEQAAISRALMTLTEAALATGDVEKNTSRCLQWNNHIKKP